VLGGISVEAPIAADASDVVGDRLRGLHRSSAGAIEHRYSLAGILSCLQFAFNLKPSASIANSLANAADLFFGHGESVAVDLRAGQVPLPSLDLLRVARVRLDILSVLHERQLGKHFKYLRYIMIDSSPQLGYNFLCMREDRIAIPRSEFTSVDFRASFDINAAFESRICMVSTLGVGNAGVVKKGLNTCNTYLMESDAWPQFHEKRCEVRNSCMDSGTEKAVGDDTVNIVEGCRGQYEADNRNSFMYPNNLHTPGHLHIIYNSLESAVKGLPLATAFMDCLLILQAFLSSTQLRRKFQVSCLGFGHIAFSKFEHYAVVHIDWRWEFLSKALDKLVPLLEVLRSSFDFAKMSLGESGLLSMALVKNLKAVLAKPHLEEFGEMLRVVGAILERYAHKLEGCWCHEAIWTSGASFKRKAEQLYAATGYRKCVWKGRMGPWFVAEGLQQLLADIALSSSELLQGFFARLDASSRGILLGAQSLLRMQLVEELTEKFSFWQHIPYKALGIFYVSCGGSMSVSKRILSECLLEFDTAISRGLGKRLHRVAQLLFSKKTVCRQQFEEFLVGSSTLEHFPVAFTVLQEYSLASLVERRIEQLHSVIKKIGMQATYVRPPYVCSKLREAQCLQTLSGDRSFYDLCLKRWRSTTFLNEVLALRVSRSMLAAMTSRAKIKMVYQCSLREEYQSTVVDRASQNQWLALTMDSRQHAAVIPPSWKACIAYFKRTLEKGCYYTLPRTLFDSALVIGTRSYDHSDIDPVALGIGVVECPTHVLQVDSTSDIVVFQILNPRPEQRNVHPVHHLERITTCVNVSICAVVASRLEGQQLIIHHDDRSTAIDLTVLVGSMRITLQSLFRWGILSKRASMRVRPNRPLLDLESYSPPALVGLPQRNSSVLSAGDSQAIVPCAGEDDRAQLLLGILVDQGAFVAGGSGAVDVLHLDGMDAGSVGVLHASGALVVADGPFGEVTVALNTAALMWQVLLLLGVPVQHCRLPLNCAPLSASKYELVLALHQQGWRPNGSLHGHWAPDQRLEYVPGMQQPASYFAALAYRDEVLFKGVDRILHRQVDGYYKCLLRMSSEPLLNLLSTMGGNNNDWFVRQLKSAGHVPVACQIDEEPFDAVGSAAVVVPMLEDIPAEIGNDNVLVETVVFSGWSRVLVDSGIGSPAFKVYFDNSTHQSGRQRGWIDSLAHDCTKYDFCSGSKVEFCTYLYLWALRGDDCVDRWAHLQVIVPVADVHDTVASIRLLPF
jgi:hypothetical protein